MNVLDGGLIPRVMSLKDALQAFIAHRREVLERRSTHRLEKIAARLEILEGYLIVYLDLDKVIKIIRNEDEPKPALIKAFKLTENQAEAILNMRLRSLRKLEEMEIRREHDNLSKEQKELKKLLSSEKLKDERLVDEIKTIDAKFGLKTALGKRRTAFVAAKDGGAKIQELAEEVANIETAVEKEPITVVCSEKGWLRSFKGHQEPGDAIKYREGDRARFWIHAQTTDKLMIFATDGRFFTLDCAKLPGGRGNGEAIRSFVDLPPGIRHRRHVPASAGPQAFARRRHRPRLPHQRRRRGRHDQIRQARYEREAGKRSRGLRLRRWRHRCGGRREPQADHLPVERSPRPGPRPGRLPPALQGRRAARCDNLHLERGPEGREQSFVRAERS